jgi:hypothetical protein
MKTGARISTTCAWLLFVGACDESTVDQDIDREEDLQLVEGADGDLDRPERLAPDEDDEASPGGDAAADPASDADARPDAVADSFAPATTETAATYPPVHPYVGDCCAAHGSPGCGDPDCTDAVCKDDPFCCGVHWDGICASEALAKPVCQGLGSCGGPVCVEEDIEGKIGWVVSRGKTLYEDTTLAPSCGLAGSSPDHVVKFKAPFSGTYIFNTFGSNYDTVLALFSSCAYGSELACNDDEGWWTTQSVISKHLYAGETVLLSVSGFNGAKGMWVLNILLDGFSGDCCAPHGTPGCDDPDCTAAICDADPFCCDHNWDGLCADAAKVAEECKGVGGSCP